MKRTITSESLFEFANRKLPISLPKSDIDDEDENFEVGSKDEEWYGEDPEDQEIIDDIEHIDLGNEIIVDDEEKENKLSNVEELNTYKTLLKHLKTIIDINKGKPDKEKNYVSFTVKGKPGDVINGIPFDVKGTKDQTTITFIRKGTKNVKFVPLKNIILENEQHPHVQQIVKESLNEAASFKRGMSDTEIKSKIIGLSPEAIIQYLKSRGDIEKLKVEGDRVFFEMEGDYIDEGDSWWDRQHDEYDDEDEEHWDDDQEYEDQEANYTMLFELSLDGTYFDVQWIYPDGTSTYTGKECAKTITSIDDLEETLADVEDRYSELWESR